MRKRYEVLKDGEIVFAGSRQQAADFLGVSLTSLSTIANSLTVTRKGYRVRVLPLEHKKKKKPNLNVRHWYVSPSREKKNLVESILPYDIAKLRSSVQYGDKVRVFREIEYTDDKVIVGEYPIVQKYRHVFTIWTGHYMESFTWVELYRKDGVELVG